MNSVLRRVAAATFTASVLVLMSAGVAAAGTEDPALHSDRGDGGVHISGGTFTGPFNFYFATNLGADLGDPGADLGFNADLGFGDDLGGINLGTGLTAGLDGVQTCVDSDVDAGVETSLSSCVFVDTPIDFDEGDDELGPIN